jgi:GH24 family phage-related lysozyme (muramidase)
MLERLKPILLASEGLTDHLYLDTKGNPTVGIGHLVPTVEISIKLPWIWNPVKAGGSATPAGEFSIADEYRMVKALPFGMKYPARFYKSKTALHLAPETIDALFEKDLAAKAAEVAAAIAGFHSFPEAAQCPLVDMAYNMGTSGLVHGFPKLMARVAAWDWAGAALECKRRDISDERNAWTASMFREAAQPIAPRT